VIVTGTDSAGQPVEVERYAGQASGSSFTTVGAPTFPNPSFDSNTTGWSTNAGGSNPIRTTTGGEYDTAPAGLKLQVSGSTIKLTASTTLSGTFHKGTVYRIQFWYQNMMDGSIRYAFLNGQLIWDDPYEGLAGPAQYATAVFVPTETVTNPTFTLQGPARLTSNPHVRLDSFSIQVATGAIPSRLGFLRRKEIQLGFTVPSDGVAAAQIGDVWLANHITTGFKGTTTVAGAAVEERASGQKIPAASLLTRTNELLHFADRIDPVTGAAGRNARIAEVSWKAAEDTATITMDSKLGNLDELLGRLAVVMGQPA